MGWSVFTNFFGFRTNPNPYSYKLLEEETPVKEDTILEDNPPAPNYIPLPPGSPPPPNYIPLPPIQHELEQLKTAHNMLLDEGILDVIAKRDPNSVINLPKIIFNNIFNTELQLKNGRHIFDVENAINNGEKFTSEETGEIVAALREKIKEFCQTLLSVSEKTWKLESRQNWASDFRSNLDKIFIRLGQTEYVADRSLVKSEAEPEVEPQVSKKEDDYSWEGSVKIHPDVEAGTVKTNPNIEGGTVNIRSEADAENFGTVAIKDVNEFAENFETTQEVGSVAIYTSAITKTEGLSDYEKALNKANDPEATDVPLPFRIEPSGVDLNTEPVIDARGKLMKPLLIENPLHENIVIMAAEIKEVPLAKHIFFFENLFVEQKKETSKVRHMNRYLNLNPAKTLPEE